MRRSATRVNPLACITLLLFVFSAASFGEARTQYESVFSIIADRSDPTDDRGYATFISNFTITALEGYGIQAIEVEDQPAIDRCMELLADGNIKGLAALKALKQSDYGLVVTYDLDEKGAELLFTCIDLKNAEVLVTVDEKAAPLLLVDTAILRAVEAVYEKAESYLVAVRNSVSDSRTDIAGQNASVSETTTISAAPKRGFILSPSFGIYQTLGAASEYFAAGIMPSISLKYDFPFPAARIAPGILIGAIYFETAGEVSESSNFLSPFAVVLDYTSVSNDIMDFVVFVSGGGAVLSMSVDNEPYVSKLIPYAGGGMGFLFFPLEKFSLGFDVSLGAFFERPKPILGYLISMHMQLK